MFSKLLVLLILAAIVLSLASAGVYLVKDGGGSNRVIKALTFRIGLSVALFALLFVLYGLGLIQPHGVLPPAP